MLNFQTRRGRMLYVSLLVPAFGVGILAGGYLGDPLRGQQPPASAEISFDDPVPGAPAWPGGAQEWVTYLDSHPRTGTETTATNVTDCMRQSLATGGPCRVLDEPGFSEPDINEPDINEWGPDGTGISDDELQDLVEEILTPTNGSAAEDPASSLEEGHR